MKSQRERIVGQLTWIAIAAMEYGAEILEMKAWPRPCISGGHVLVKAKPPLSDFQLLVVLLTGSMGLSRLGTDSLGANVEVLPDGLIKIMVGSVESIAMTRKAA